MTTEKDVRKYIKLKDVFDNRCVEVAQLLSKLDSSYYGIWHEHGVISFYDGYNNRADEEYIYLASEEYYIGHGRNEIDYSEFPLRYLWTDNETIKTEIKKRGIEK